MDLKPGTEISPQLRLVQELGEGGRATLWIAERVTTGERVAVKFIANELLGVQSDLARFEREARLAAKIDSPHVVRILDYGLAANGRPFIVMDLLEGENLAQRFARSGPLGIRPTNSIIQQVALALESAHKLGIVHRDIKPANLFLTTIEGVETLKVLDYGIAKQVAVIDGITTSGTLVGTPKYMSPEQLCDSKHADPRMDLWALAVEIYEALTGHPPFYAKPLSLLSLLILQGKFARPSSLLPSLPPQLDEWFARALHRDLDQRFKSAQQMAHSFERAIS